MGFILDLLYAVAIIVLAPVIWVARRRKRRSVSDWPARFFGFVPRRSGGRKCIWFHGVSVGEVHMIAKVAAVFRDRFPAFDITVSSTTPAGLAAARRLFSDDQVVVWPVDFSWAVSRALRRISPEIVVLAESELWPNFLRSARRLGIPVAVINGRMSPTSARRYRRFAGVLRPLFRGIRLWAMQTQEYADVVRPIASGTVAVTGNVKYDGVLTDRRNEATQAFRSLFHFGDDPIWVAGSTQAPEEEIVLDTFRTLRTRYPRLRLVIVPRQPSRFEQVARLLSATEFMVVRRSRVASRLDSTPDIVLIDSLGELSAIWGLADIAFVGGSLDGKRGGQNMIEPAALGAAIIFGPYTWNFRSTVELLLAHEAAIEVQDAAELTTAVESLLASPQRRAEMGKRARRLMLEQQGAAERTVELLSRFFERSEARHAA